MWKQIMEIWMDVILLLALQEPSWKRAQRRRDDERKQKRDE